MTAINRTAAAAVGAVMPMLAPLGPVLSLAVLSLLTALALLVLVRVASNQRRIAGAKRSIRAALLEIRLFNHDLRAILRAQGEALRHNLTYLRLSLTPMLWAALPLALLIAHLQPYYGYDALAPGATAVVTARVAGNWMPVPGQDADSGPPVTLDAPAGVSVETRRVWTGARREASWRIRGEQPGNYDLVVRLGDEAATKRVRIAGELASRSALRPGPSLLDAWLHPLEPALRADAPLEAISVTYPERRLRIVGLELHWLVVFFVLTMLFAFALKGRFGVVL